MILSPDLAVGFRVHPGGVSFGMMQPGGVSFGIMRPALSIAASVSGVGGRGSHRITCHHPLEGTAAGGPGWDLEEMRLSRGSRRGTRVRSNCHRGLLQVLGDGPTSFGAGFTGDLASLLLLLACLSLISCRSRQNL